ncbi:helix-turn-helix domain-containing protein [Streptomyces sp. NBC_00669]|uniref:helix-turn-helix domain-containing protein n=1 Tax=unclassified Streptomyces TaxID=2593676 RepID=UPI002E1FF875|nr:MULTISPECIES: helix-turn-helix transcriptional regulator [unclassified Streptomyces]
MKAPATKPSEPTAPMQTFLSGEVTARALYAHHLAELRRKAGLTLVELSDRCHYEQSYLHRLETGGRLGTLEVATALDRIYATDGLLVQLWHLAKREGSQLTAGGIAALETTAAGIQEYALSTVPDLLQTPAYAEERLTTTGPRPPNALTAQIEALRRRQTRLTNHHTPPTHYRAILDEVVLHRAARSPATWLDQLDHLIDAAHHPAIAVQILPLHTGPHLLHGPLQVLTYRDGRTLAYAHSTTSGHFIDDPDDIQQLRHTYDALRDLALTPTQSLSHLQALRTAYDPNDRARSDTDVNAGDVP